MSAAVVISQVRHAIDTPFARWLMLPAICAAYIQGGLVKALDFNGAMAEMTHFGLQPAALFAGLVILLELGASALILTGFYRWLGALALAGFTLAATLMANRFWEMNPPERFIGMNGFFEHIGLAGALLLVALYDLKEHKDG
ncbi:DoxX family protein [Pseudomonas lundensis]|uniref:DoxX family protein n=1 Tax=Serratia proteamaculans TaxID=28151 RepID=UPI0029821B8C|nr:DoxX family protein [Serratia proteamaculans]MDW5498938.1 DoxX family protein [Serratia proteamaculans]MDW5503996.1 DoxX family protein [Pseudomonas lundensis]